MHISMVQVLVVAFSTLYFGDTVPFLNGLGIVVVIFGSYLYGVTSINEKIGSSS